MVEFSGFYESHGPTSSGHVRGIVPAHCHGHQNGQQSGHILHRCFVFCHPGGCRGDTERGSCLMAVFNGFYESPGPPTLGDARGIAPLHRHGY